MEVTLWKRDMLSGMSRSVIAEAALAADRDFHSNIFSIITGEKTMEIYKGKSVFGGRKLVMATMALILCGTPALTSVILPVKAEAVETAADSEETDICCKQYSS